MFSSDSLMGYYECQREINMILPFRGHGYLVVVFYVARISPDSLAVDSLLGEGFYTSHSLPKYIAVAVGVCFAGSWKLAEFSHSPTRLMDLDTGQQFVVPPPRHEFLYLRMETGVSWERQLAL